MKLRDFEYVEAIARRQSFSKAADELFVSQPALTQSIQRLETELNLPLFTREHNRITLTMAGEIFLEDALRILKITNRLKKRLSSIDDMSNKTIQLGISTFYGAHIMPIVMSYIKVHYPGIHINLVEDKSYNLETLLDNNELDFALIPFPITVKSLHYQLLFDEEVLLAAHKDKRLPGVETMPPDTIPFINLSLVQEPLILLKEGQKFRAMTDAILQEHNIVPDIFFETANLSTVEAFIKQDQCVGFLPSSLPKSPDVTYYRFNSKCPNRRKYVIAYKEDNYLVKSSIEIINIIKKALRERNLITG